MSNILNLPTAEQFDVHNKLLAILASGNSSDGLEINNFKDVQRIVRMGLADKVFTVGDQFIAEYDGTPHKWDIIGINHDKPSDPKYEHSLTIQAHDCLLNAQFSAPQALGYTATELPAGDQYFTFDNVQYKFTTTLPITEGGVIYISTRDDYIPLTVTTYMANRKDTIESNLAVSVVTGQTDTITEVNDKIRTRYGSNNYIESGIKQWLNSENNAFTWESKTNFDMPSTYTTKGFLKLLDPKLVEVLGAVDKQVARNAVTDGGGQDLFSDKVFLLSRVEIYGTNEGVVTGEKAYDYYSVMNPDVTDAAVDWRIKYLGESPQSWWLRSPNVGYSYNTRIVYPTGSVNHTYAYYARGTAPACVII